MHAPASTNRHVSEGFRHAPVRTADESAVCAGQLRIQGRPAAVATVIRSADSASREHLVGQLQRQVGNASVSRLLASDAGSSGGERSLPVQRWAVTVAAGTADCMVVVNWLNQHSPYRALSGWALTSPTFGWSGDFSYSGSADSLRLGMTHPAVTLGTTVDMPHWAPTDGAMKQAWANMTTELRAHEARHEEVATNWKATLLARMTSLSLSVASRAEGPGAFRRDWASWLAEHQADQSALDPFTALLDCSGGGDTAEAETSAADPTGSTESARDVDGSTTA